MILVRLIFLDIFEIMLSNPGHRELGKSLILEYCSISADRSNTVDERDYYVLLGNARATLNEREWRWRDRRTGS
jgi:hypothetical protein